MFFKKTNSSVYIAIILSNYQELNLKRFIVHCKIKERVILIKYSDEEIQGYNFSKNVKKTIFKSKFFYLIYFFFTIVKYLFINKKFIFGNPNGNFCRFIRKFISGKDQIYVDDGTAALNYNYNKLKKNCTVFTNYKIKPPTKIKVIYYSPKYIKQKKKFARKFYLLEVL